MGAQAIGEPADRTVYVLVHNWWAMALRGVVALLFGLLAFFRPVASIAALILVFGCYAVANGLLTVFAAIANRHGEPHWASLLISGLLSIGAGVVTFVMPGVTAVALLYIIAAWAFVTGVAEIVTAVRLRRVVSDEWMLLLAGALSVLFAVVLVLRPGVGALAVVLWIGSYAILLGVLLLALAFRLRSWDHGHVAGRTARTV